MDKEAGQPALCVSGTGSENTPLLKTSNRRETWPQHMAALSAGLMTMSMGFVSGWSAFATPYLQGKLEKVEFEPINASQVSWIASIITLGALCGALPSGKMARLMGRKWYLIFLSLPLLSGWLLILFYRGHVPFIYAGRFLCGIAFGGVTVTVPLYNNEIAENNLRGKIGSYFDLMLCLGLLMVYVVGAFTSYYGLTAVCGLFPIVFLLTFVWMPESPYHFVSCGKIDEAKDVLRWLRRGISTTELDEEIHEMANILHASLKCAPSFNVKKSFDKLKQWNITFKAVVMAFGLMTFQRLSGVTAIVFYTVEIFRAANTSIKPQHATILVGILGVVGCLLSAFLVDRLGRKVLLMYSGFVISLSFAFMSVYFAAADYDMHPIIFSQVVEENQVFGWIPVLSLSSFLCAYCVGFGFNPWFLLSQLITKETQNWTETFFIIYTSTLSFIVLKFFIGANQYFGSALVYSFFTVISSVCILFVYKFIPDTKNCSLEELFIDFERLKCNRAECSEQEVEFNRELKDYLYVF